MKTYPVNSQPASNGYVETPSLFWEKLLLSLLVFAVISRIFIMARYEVNWDEFYYLSFVYQYLNNNLDKALQTFHVHFFSWLELVSNNEVNQIVAARAIMLLLQLATGVIIYRISYRFMDKSAALFSVFSYFCVSYVLKTGASFRVDPIATFFLMASLDLILLNSKRIKYSILISALLALSLMITIKSVLYIPTIILIVVVLLYDSDQRKKDIIRFLMIGISSVLFWGLLYYFHKVSLNLETAGNDISIMTGGFNKTLNHNVFFPRKIFMFHSLIIDFVFWITFIYGFMITVFSFKKGIRLIVSPINAMLLLAFVLPLLSVFVYRNAFPYFYAFMLAPASIFCGIAWHSILSINKQKVNFVASLIVFLLFVNIISNGFVFPYRKNLDRQRTLLEVIHKAFPTPVKYFDRCSMVSSFPQVGFFMSTWGVENYRQAEIAVIAESIKKQKPVFFIANTALLDLSGDLDRYTKLNNSLLHSDELAIQENYIHHWGEIYVAGKQFYLEERGAEEQFSIVIEGIYTLEGESEVFIDNMLIKPGKTVNLLVGSHAIKAKENKGFYKLRWGDKLYRPKTQPQVKGIFNGF